MQDGVLRGVSQVIFGDLSSRFRERAQLKHNC